jgi:RNA polymerase sigma-70 factor (ECF subfamily)
LRRNSGRERSLSNGTEADNYDLPIESAGLSPEQQSEREERRIEIEAVVRSLPTAYRELVVLRHSQDLTYEEIVDVTGLPLGTVKNRLFRAREMMRQQFLTRGITSV